MTMRARSLGWVVLLALAACQKPNLESTGGGYGGRGATAQGTQVSSDAPAAAEADAAH